jgi:hypothetical protein
MICIRALQPPYVLPVTVATARLIADALRDSPQAASLLERCEASRRAACAIAPICRALSGFDPLLPGVCELRGETLWLTLPSPSYVAKTRQALPRLLSALAADGMAVYEIRTRVQPAVTSYPTDGIGSGSSYSNWEMQWPPAGRVAIDSVANIATRLSESPLKQATQKLAATLRKRAARQATHPR